MNVLEVAAGVGRGDDVGAGGADVGHLQVENLLCRGGLDDVVDAGAAAAEVGRLISTSVRPGIARSNSRGWFTTP